MKRKKNLTSLMMTQERRGLIRIAWRVFYINSPRGCELKSKVTEAFILEIVSKYEFRLPCSTQEFSRFVARETYKFWKERGWKKKRKGKKVVWTSPK